MDVAEWLQILGLVQYAAAFRKNDITPALLPDLTAADLRELGVTSVGHRRKLLDAISVLGQKDVETADGLEMESKSSKKSQEDQLGAEAERRHLTVMFCDLVGSTEMSSRLDPEDFGQIVSRYQERVREAVNKFNGFIARYVGDGVLIYFGWPETSETDAERAVRAALAIKDAMIFAPIEGEPLAVRVGIASGTLVVGGAVGSDESYHYTAVGEATILAARLQTLAEPNAVVIDATTRRQIGGLFDCKELGTVQLKGFPRALPAFRVTGECKIESRFKALRGSTMTRLIGRDEELDWILRRWQLAKSGEGQVVLLAGEPGIGKSRLIAAIEDRLRGEAHGKMRYFCSPYHQETALHPIIARWELEACFALGDDPTAKFEKLESLLLSLGTPNADIPLIADLLAVPVNDRYAQLKYGLQQRKAKTLDALTRGLQRRAQQQPILMLCEDIHWADPSSLDLLDAVVGLVPGICVLLVASYRPEFSAPWIGQSNVSLVTLNRLGRRHAREFLAEVATDHSVPAVVAERIIEHADGMPLLIEELTKAALESADRVEPQITEMTVFATLQVSLLARLNRMPIAKRVGQIAAVIGREFSHRLLAAVAKMPDTTLSQGLGELVASGLVFCRGAPPNATYTFKHALVHEAAYQTILRGTRRRLHASTASIIQESLPEVALYQPEVLAHHFAAAGDDEQAVAWFLAAGDLATRRYAHAEARSQYRRALDTLGRTSETDDNRRRYIDATVKYTAVSYAAMNPNEHLDLLRIAEAAAHKLPAAASAAGEDSLRLARVSYSLGRTLHYLNRLPDAMRYYRNVLDMADVSGDDEMLGVCSGMVGRVLSIQGQFAEAASFLSRALPVLERLGVHSEYISALNFLGLTYAARGDYDAGLSIAERARRIAVDLDFPTAIAAIHILKWGIHQQGGNTCGMLESAQTIVSISERTGDKMYLYLGYGMLAWAEALLENPFVGLSHLERSREVRNELGGHAVLTDWFSALYAELLFRLGRPAEAIRVADDATVEATAAGDIFAEGMARRTWAASLMRLDGSNWSEAESQLERSLQAFLTGDAQVEAARTHLTWALLGKQRGSEITFLEHTRLAERVFGSSRLHREWEQVRIASPTIQTNKLRVLSDWGR